MINISAHIANSYYEIGNTEKASSTYQQVINMVKVTDTLTEDEAINLAIIYDHAARLERNPDLINRYFNQAIALHRRYQLTYYYMLTCPSI